MSADFGVSSRLKRDNTRANSFIGTPFWMAPEVIKSENDADNWYDCKADIWSIGITTIELADKAPPFCEIHPFTALKKILQGFERIGLANPAKRSKTLNDFISFCLIRDPDVRPSAADLLEHPFLRRTDKIDSRKVISDLLHKKEAEASIKRPNRYQESDYDEIEEELDAENHENPEIPNVKGLGESVALSPLEFSCEFFCAQISEYKAISPSKPCFLIQENVNYVVFLEKYALLASDRGLIAASLVDQKLTAAVIIPSVRFKQLEILEEYGVMMAICGKHSHIRQYPLTTIAKLVSFGIKDRREKELLQYLEAAKLPDYGASTTGAILETPQNNSSVLRDYVKICGTKNCNYFNTEKTTGSIFLLAICNKTTLSLFEWAKAPYTRFMKVKSLWLPEQPLFCSLFHDNFFACEIMVAYPREANAISIESGIVREIIVSKEFEQSEATPSSNSSTLKASNIVQSFSRVINNSMARGLWKSFHQICSDENKFTTMSNTFRRTGNVNPKLAAAVSPYNPSNEALPAFERKCLATFHRVTYLTDSFGVPLSDSPRFEWIRTPNKLLLVPKEHLIAFSDDSIEVRSIESGKLIQNYTCNQFFKTLDIRKKDIVLISKIKQMESKIYIIKASNGANITQNI